ncbi:Solute carrier 26 [Chytriomyces hyalinus]|nr:Solute carrier 26 [Chytriomyces hyalinus]
MDSQAQTRGTDHTADASRQERHALLSGHALTDQLDGIGAEITQIGTSFLADLKHLAKSTLHAAPMFPLVGQIRQGGKKGGYSWSTLGSDLIGAATVTMILLPQCIAYASLLHIPEVNSLISGVFPVILYAVFGGSRVLSVGPEATICIIVGAAVLEQKDAFPGFSAVEIASALCFLVGLLMIVLSLLQAGFIDHILSGYLQTGFITGAALLIMTEQLPSALGLTMRANESESAISQFINVCRNIGTAKYATVIVSATNILFLFALRFVKKKYVTSQRWLKYVPEYLVLVIIMTTISAVANLSAYGIVVLGEFSSTIPTPAPPKLSYDLLSNLFQSAVTVFLVGYIEAMTVTRNFGLRSGYVPSGNRELFALGFTNLVSSFFGCVPVFASLPRSRILTNCGAKSTLSNALAGVFIFIAFTALKSVFRYIPKAMLSSIIIVSAFGLIETHEIMFIFRTRAWTEVAMLLATFIITIATSLSTGILLCVGLSAILILRQTTNSSISIMGRVPIHPAPPFRASAIPPTPTPTPSYESQDHLNVPPKPSPTPSIATNPIYTSITENPSALLLDGVIMLRVDVPIKFYNCAQLRRSMEKVMTVEKKALLARRRRAKQAAEAEARADRPIVAGGISIDFGVEESTGWLVAGTAQAVDDLHGHEEDEDDAEPFYRDEEGAGETNQNRDTQSLHQRLKKRGAENGLGIGVYDSSGDLPLPPHLLRHESMSRGSSMRSRRMHNAPNSGDDHEHLTEGKVIDRRNRRRRETLIHTVVMDFKHCLELDTAAALILLDIFSTFIYDGIEVFVSGMQENQKALLMRGDSKHVVSKFCTFCPDMATAVTLAEEKMRNTGPAHPAAD